MPLEVSAMVPEMRRLLNNDPSGDTWVKIKPPGFEEEKQRGQLLKKRSYSYDDDGYLNTDVDCNVRQLWATELWLTFEEANIHVKFVDDEGETVKEVKMVGTKDDYTYSEFMEKLNALPTNIIYEWRSAVVDVIPDWRNPF